MKIWLLMVGLWCSVIGQLERGSRNEQYSVEERTFGSESDNSQFNGNLRHDKRRLQTVETERELGIFYKGPQVHEINPLYSYSYDVEDLQSGDVKSHRETRRGNQVRGSYSVVEPDGTLRTVEYSADPITGFNAFVQNSGIQHQENRHNHKPSEHYPAKFKPRYLYKQVAIYPNVPPNNHNHNLPTHTSIQKPNHISYSISYKTPASHINPSQ